MEKATVITGSDITKFRYRTILRGLELEVKTNMKHSRNSVVNAAKDILKRAGKHVPRRKAHLLIALRALFSDPAFTGNILPPKQS